MEDDKYNLNEGDVFIIKPGEKSYILAENLNLVTIASPNWYSEQCKIVNN